MPKDFGQGDTLVADAPNQDEQFWLNDEPASLADTLEAAYLPQIRDRLTNTPVVSNFPSFVSGLAQGGAMIEAPIARMAGDDYRATRAHAIRRAAEIAASERSQEYTAFGTSPIVARGVRGALATLPAAVPAGAATGPYGAIAVGAVQQMDSAYDDAKRAGLSEDQAVRHAAIQGALEGGIASAFQKVGLGGLESVLGQSAKEGVRQGLWKTLKSAGVATLQELPEELITNLAQSVEDKLSGVDPNSLTPEAIQQTIADTTAQTLVTMGAVELPNLARASRAAAEAKAFRTSPERQAAREQVAQQTAQFTSPANVQALLAQARQSGNAESLQGLASSESVSRGDWAKAGLPAEYGRSGEARKAFADQLRAVLAAESQQAAAEAGPQPEPGQAPAPGPEVTQPSPNQPGLAPTWQPLPEGAPPEGIPGAEFYTSRAGKTYARQQIPDQPPLQDAMEARRAQLAGMTQAELQTEGQQYGFARGRSKARLLNDILAADEQRALAANAAAGPESPGPAATPQPAAAAGGTQAGQGAGQGAEPAPAEVLKQVQDQLAQNPNATPDQIWEALHDVPFKHVEAAVQALKGTPNAVSQGIEQESRVAEHPGVARGSDLRADQGQVRPAEGEQAGRGNRPLAGGPEQQAVVPPEGTRVLTEEQPPPKKTGKKPITKSDVAKTFPGAKITDKPGGWRVEVGGQYVDIDATTEPIPIPTNHPQYGESTEAQRKGAYAAGSFSLRTPDGTVHDGLGVIRIALGEGDEGTLLHERNHLFQNTLMLRPDEFSRLVDRFSSRDKTLQEQKEDVARAAEKVPPTDSLWVSFKSWLLELLERLGIRRQTADELMTMMNHGWFQQRRQGVNPLAPPESQFQPAYQTSTPEFKKWFGNSKVTSADGTPLVVYHGTTEDFSSFPKEKRPSQRAHSAALGHFFTDDPEAAGGTYAEGEGARIMPVFLSIKNPKRYDSILDLSELIGSRGDALRLRESLIEQGYDGIIMPHGRRSEYVAFEPSQIKSATANRGTFDPTNADIQFQPAYHGSPHKFDKFSTEKIGTGEGAQAYGWGLYFAGKKEVAEFYRNRLTHGKMLEYEGEEITYDDLENRLAEQFGDTTADRFIHDIRSGFMPLEAARLNAVRQRLSPAQSAALEHVAEGIQFLRREERPRWHAVPEGGIRADKKMTPEERYALWDIHSRLSFLNTETSPAEAISRVREQLEKTVDAQTQNLQRYPDETDAERVLANAKTALSVLDKYSVQAKLREPKGRGYKVDLKPSDDEYILWDKPKSEQSDKVLRLTREGGLAWGNHETGEQFYESVARGQHVMNEGQRDNERASKLLASRGIRGIKYLDQGSRDTGEGSHNYVIFDDADVSIEEMFQPVRVPDEVKAPKADVERQLAASHGVQDGPSLLSRIAEWGASFAKALTRAQYYIPRSAKWATANEHFRLFKQINPSAQDNAARAVAWIIGDLSPGDLQLFSRKAVIDNLYDEVKDNENVTPEERKPLRFGFETVAEVQQYKQQLDDLAAKSPKVEQALERRKQAVNGLVDELIGLDLLPKEAKDRADTYYHQQVLNYLNATKGLGANPQITKKSFQKKRVAGVEQFDESLNYNTSYLEAEYAWMRDAQQSIAKEKWLRELDKRFNAKAEFKPRPDETHKQWRNRVEASGTHKVWQAAPGNVFYKATGLPERIVAEVLSGTDVYITPEDLKDLVVMGGRQRELVLPKEIASQLDAMQRPVSGGDPFGEATASISRELQGNWKVWMLNAPHKVLGYNARNLTGDIDAVLGAAPGVFGHLPKSLQDISSYYYGNKGKALPADIATKRDLGVFDASLTAADIPDVKELESFKKFYTSNPANPVRWAGKYFEAVRKFGKWRESLLRSAAYDYYKAALDAGTLAHYGGARKAVVDALAQEFGNEVAAAHLSRNLLGDYGDLTVLGNTLRRHVLPFWSWSEVNLKRYPQLFVNAAAFGPRAAKNNPALAGAYSAIALGGVTLPYLLMQLFNRLAFPDEEKQLSDDDRASAHLIWGRLPDGSIGILRNTTALGEFFEWFGVNTMISRLDELQGKQMTPAQVAAEMGRDVVNKALQGLRPEAKAAYELSTGQSLYPNVFSPRPARRDELAAGYLGLTDYYREARGRALQEGSRARPNLLARSLGVSDPRKNSLYEILELRERFLGKLGEPSPYQSNPYFVNMREAAIAGRPDAFREARAAYIKNGGDYEKFLSSTRGLDPIAQRLKDADEKRFVDEFLTPDQRQKLQVARDYGNNLSVEMWRLWNEESKSDPKDLALKLGQHFLRDLAEPAPKFSNGVPKKEREKGVTWKQYYQGYKDRTARAIDFIRQHGIERGEALSAYEAMTKHLDPANRRRGKSQLLSKLSAAMKTTPVSR